MMLPGMATELDRREAEPDKRNGEPYRCWRWAVPPGSEEPSEDLPGVVGWAP
jgi:hypothetical protein